MPIRFSIRYFRLQNFVELNEPGRTAAILKMLDAAARSVFPEYVLELEGMASGLQFEYETLLIWNCRGDLPLSDDAIPESAKHSPEGCTTLLYPAAKVLLQ